MDVRIFRWPRFVELFEDFRELFADHLNRVKNKSSLDHFEAKNDIKEWEWRVMLSMCGPTDRIPAPFSSESLCGFSLITAFLTLVAVTAMGSLIGCGSGTHCFGLVPRSSPHWPSELRPQQ